MMRKINPRVAAKWTAWIISTAFLVYVAFVLVATIKGAK
jgi:hypothetical protein